MLHKCNIDVWYTLFFIYITAALPKNLTKKSRNLENDQKSKCDYVFLVALNFQFCQK